MKNAEAVSKLKLRAFLKEENAKNGTTILLTTHDMEDMLALCNRVMVLGHGKLLYDGALDALLKQYDTAHTLRVVFEDAPNVTALTGDVKRDGDTLRVLSEGIADVGLSSVKVSRDGDAYILTYEPAVTPTSELLPWVLSAGRVREMTLKEQNVDELIARMYKELQL